MREREKALERSTGPPWYLYTSGRDPSRGGPMDRMRLRSTLRKLGIQMSEFGVTACIIRDTLVWSGVQNHRHPRNFHFIMDGTNRCLVILSIVDTEWPFNILCLAVG